MVKKLIIFITKEKYEVQINSATATETMIIIIPSTFS
jgi:hypothetical protein